MNPAVHARLIKSWANVFYNVVFCGINEVIFSKLYCTDNGRPNFPVNILLSLEYIKCLFDYSDAELIELTKQFVKESKVSVNEQRMDSTMISANIKNAGRLALAYDVIEQALKVMPEELMTKSMKEVLEDGYKSKLLYKSKGNQVISRLQEILDICGAVMETIENIPEIVDLPEMKLLERFIEEQTNINFGTL